MKKFEEKKPGTAKWFTVIIVVLLLFLASYMFAGMLSLLFGEQELPTGGNIALIPIEGVLMSSGSSLESGVVSSGKIVEFIKKADENDDIKAIIFDINSPGGSGVASEEIANAIKKVNKTKVSFIRELGASGAYWVASATDRIFVSRMSLTGSIGVTASYLEFAGLMKDYNVTYRRLVAGKYKDMGSPFKELAPEEQEIFEKQLKTVHDFFIEEVAKNRKLSNAAVRQLATGEPILGANAKEFGLVDELGGKEDAIRYVENKLNITAEIAEYKQKRTFLELLQGYISDHLYNLGFGIGRGLSYKEEKPIVWT